MTKGLASSKIAGLLKIKQTYQFFSFLLVWTHSMASTRDQIIQTTCDLIELQGYHATGLNQIIKESGSPKGSLYYHFPGGKEELAVEAIRLVGGVVHARIQENLAQIENPADAVRTFIMNVAYHVELSGFRAGGPITIIALETASTSVVLRQECERIYSGWQAVFAEKLAAGGIKQERTRSLATLIISAIEGGIILCRTERSRIPLESAAQELALLIQSALP